MTLGSHHRPVGKSQTWLTPRWILDALGPFDLDPCAADPRPWDCARVNYTEAQDGLALPWFGRVWCNPPFNSRIAGRWVQRMAEHNNGVLLMHARTETRWFSHIWRGADSILFLDKRLNFIDGSGQLGIRNSGAPIVLAAFGQANTDALRVFGPGGRLVSEWSEQ